MQSTLFRTGGIVLASGCLVWLVYDAAPASTQTARSFAEDVEKLSEPSGYFDTDNLISNEQSYLEVVPELIARGIQGGAYIGVGPDQNFSYIARIRPSIAYIIDVRRDNLLLHLLLKALFEQAETRLQYLCLLTGRAPPAEADQWISASLERIVTYVEGAPEQDDLGTLRDALERTIMSFGVPLSADELLTVAQFHQAFISDGLSLQFRSYGRSPRPYYPTLRDLLLATDRQGHPWNYLASEDDYQFIRSLQKHDEIVPVVGDVAGPHALAAIGDRIAQDHQQVTAFYISNVEFYLSPVRYRSFVENVKRLPKARGSVMIRSIFGGGPSRTTLQPLDSLTR